MPGKDVTEIGGYASGDIDGVVPRFGCDGKGEFLGGHERRGEPGARILQHPLERQNCLRSDERLRAFPRAYSRRAAATYAFNPTAAVRNIEVN